MKLITHLHLILRLRMSGAMSPFSHVMLWLVLNEAPEKYTSFQNNAQNYIPVLK